MKKLPLILFSLLFIWTCGGDKPTYLSLELRDDNLYYLDNKPYTGEVEEYFDQTGYTGNDGTTMYYNIPIPQKILSGTFEDGKIDGYWKYYPLRDGGKNNVERFYGKRYSISYSNWTPTPQGGIDMTGRGADKYTYDLTDESKLLSTHKNINESYEKIREEFSQSAFKNYLESLERWALMRAVNDY